MMEEARSWDLEADVIVVGFGGAGSAAAMEAHDRGAKVVVIEKASEGGGSTAASGGGVSIPLQPVQMDSVVAYLLKCGKGDIDESIAIEWAKEAVNLSRWIEGLGGKLEMQEPAHPSLIGGHHRNYEGYEQINFWRLPSGEDLFKVLKRGVDIRGIKVYPETRAERLFTECGGEIIGVKAVRNEQTILFKARKAVILTCGGFGQNEEMKRDFLRIYPCYSLGAHTCTGDGILMGQAVGAALNKMNELCGALVHHFPGYKCGWYSLIQGDAGRKSCVIVNKYGRRFTNEQSSYDTFYKALLRFNPDRDEWTNIPAYVIFDEKTRLAGPVAWTIPRLGEYTWSTDNSVEIEKGWIKRGDTVKTLADKVGLDDTLVDTVNRYNDFCRKGADLEFNRKLGLIPLDEPPFYVIEGFPGFFDTFGGLKINEKAQVINVFGKVIQRLYAAGTTANRIAGFYYPISGTAIGDAFIFGKIAARNAVMETSI